MPGFILHIAAAQMLFDKLSTTDGASALGALSLRSVINPDAFQVGNLIADSVSDKTQSHFRHPSRQEKLMVYPDLDLFLDKYNPLLSDSSCLGYYYHLFIDRVYAKDYIPQIVTFYDVNGQEASDRKDISHALIKRTDELVPIKSFFSDEYYYGDFTKMNTYLMNRFSISTDLVCDVVNPGIEEVDYANMYKIHKQLDGYLAVPEDAVNELRVFDMEDLLGFLEEAAEMFVEMIEHGI